MLHRLNFELFQRKELCKHREEVVSWVLQYQHDRGGFSGNIGHDPHILYTLSVVQILALLDKLDAIDADMISAYIMGLQQEDGSFAGEEWGEIDSRFSYCAVCCLSLFHRLDKIDVGKAISYVASGKNFDGGFGCTPGGEIHAGQIFCYVGALAISGALTHVDRDLLGWWLCERQLKSGGLNGRPEKLADVCYSWWVLSSLTIITSATTTRDSSYRTYKAAAIGRVTSSPSLYSILSALGTKGGRLQIG